MSKFNLPRLRRYMEQGSIPSISTGVSSLFPSGSTKFGDTPDDTHQFTGSIFAGEVSGTNATFDTISASNYLGFPTGSVSAGLGSNTFVGDQTITGNLYVSGIITSNELHITYVTSSVLYMSGSTKFGDSIDDIHEFTGSIFASEINGTNATFDTLTGSLFGTASYALLAATASYYDTSSLLVTASVSDDTITVTKGDNSTFDLTINNVVNAQTASFLNGFSQGDYLTTASFDSFVLNYNTGSFSGSFVGTLDGTASNALQAETASVANSLNGFDQNEYLTTSSFDSFVSTYNTGSFSGSFVGTLDGTASNADLLDGRDSITFANTGSNTFTGIQILQQDLTGTNAYFSGDIFINGTASISNLETRNQQSLVVGDKYIVILSGGVDHVGLDGAGILFGSGGVGPTVDENGANAYLRFRNTYDALEIFPNLRVSGSAIISNNLTVTGSTTLSTVSGTTAQFNSITASFNGNGSNITNITASNITNFTSDVRSKLSGTQYADYNISTGVISLPYTGSIIGTTPVILSQTVSSLTGLTSISSSIGQFNQLSASSATFSNLSANNITEVISPTQTITSAAYQIIPSSSLIKVSSSATYVLNATPTIKISGYPEGLKIWLVNVSNTTLTFKDETKVAGTKLRLGAQKDCVLTEWGSLQLILVSGSTGLNWVEISRGA